MSDHINRSGLRPRFWEDTDLGDMSPAEWEALCDGCGKCCLIKLEDEDTGAIAWTNIACRLFDDGSCSCGNYALRKQLVAGCVVLTPQNIDRIAHWMPATCAYRRLAEGDTLPDWHPLVSGNPDSVRAAGVSVAGKTVPEYEVDEEDFQDYVVGEDS